MPGPFVVDFSSFTQARCCGSDLARERTLRLRQARLVVPTVASVSKMERSVLWLERGAWDFFCANPRLCTVYDRDSLNGSVAVAQGGSLSMICLFLWRWFRLRMRTNYRKIDVRRSMIIDD
jgi:hypothetical protein